METVDACVGRVVEPFWPPAAAADHRRPRQLRTDARRAGECPDRPQHQSGSPILVDPDHRGQSLRPGILADLAPTILDLMGLHKPVEMTGRCLLEE